MKSEKLLFNSKFESVEEKIEGNAKQQNGFPRREVLGKPPPKPPLKEDEYLVRRKAPNYSR